VLRAKWAYVTHYKAFFHQNKCMNGSWKLVRQLCHYSSIVCVEWLESWSGFERKQSCLGAKYNCEMFFGEKTKKEKKTKKILKIVDVLTNF
jgi:hypothetical protein